MAEINRASRKDDVLYGIALHKGGRVETARLRRTICSLKAKMSLLDLCCMLESVKNLQLYFRLIDIGIEPEKFYRICTGPLYSNQRS